METVLNTTSANAMLKELYDGQKIQIATYTNNPFLAMIPKSHDFGGKYKPLPIIYNNSQGRSATFATALANQTSASIDHFLLTRASDYSIATIQNELMLASETDPMSFMQGSKVLIDRALSQCVNSLCSALFRTGTGTIGAISTISTGVITLVNAGDIVQFELNQVLQANATDGGTPRAALGYVIAVNRAAGTLTVSDVGYGGAAGTPSGWTAADSLLVQGDNNLKIKGLGAWLPLTSPTSTPFFGVDRSVDSRLGGLRWDGRSQTIEEAALDALGLVGREGGNVSKAVTSFSDYTNLEKSLGSKVQYIDLKGPAEVGFRGIRINGPTSFVDVFPDRSCPSKLMYMLDMDTWKLECLGDAPMILKYGDNLDMLRVSNSDASEVRIGYYAQLGCNDPGKNIVVQLS